jgi:predicted  nucleic acid-binding Zn-ribbon protein
LSGARRLCHNAPVDPTVQAAPPSAVPEGLPFWLLWFLLCVILLLTVFIFLRDKDLRRRISAFLSGARRHMTRLRIQAKLKKEREKKVSLWRELGKQAWDEDIQARCIEGECARLAVLDEEIGRHQKTWHDVYSRIEALGREHDAALKRFRELIAEQEEARRPHQDEMLALAGRKRELLEALEATFRETEAAKTQLAAIERDARQIKANARLSETERAARLDKTRGKAGALTALIGALSEKAPRLQDERYRLDGRLEEVEARVRVVNAAIRRIEEEYRERLQAQEKEIREWQRSKERVQDKIVDVKRLMVPLFETVGRILDESRFDHEELAVVYFQIDNVNKTIAELESRLEHLI